jgi:hypothetical protein
MITECLNIIHLPHRSDRWNLLQTELSQQHISNTKMWNGIVDEALPCKGISKAHKQIISWAKGNGLEDVLIAEDDLHFSAAGAFDHFINCKPFDFDIYLGGISWGSIRSDGSVHDFSGTTLYFANERFYDTLLNLPEDKDYDRAMAGLGRFFVCMPMVVMQHNGFSDNHQRHVDYGPVLRRMKWFSQ